AVEYDDEIPTEDNIPAIGNPKRIPHLHVLAKRYAVSHMSKESCEKYDQIASEGGEFDDDAKRTAARAYTVCAETAAAIAHFDDAERALEKSERYLPGSERHAHIRRKMAKDQYHGKIAKLDLDAAIAAYDAYQRDAADEDERIWMGEQLTGIAIKAKHDGD